MSRRLHAHQTAIIGRPVKKGMNLDTPPSKLLPHIKGKFHISAVYVRDFFNYRIKFIFFFIHKTLLFTSFHPKPGWYK